MNIDITIRNDRYYVNNEAVRRLVRKDTVDIQDMRALRDMGHTVNMTREPLIVDGVRVV